MAGFFSDMDESDFNEAPRKEVPPIIVAPEVPDDEEDEAVLDGPGVVSMAELGSDDDMNEPEDEDVSFEEPQEPEDTLDPEEDQDFGEMIVENQPKPVKPEKKKKTEEEGNKVPILKEKQKENPMEEKEREPEVNTVVKAVKGTMIAAGTTVSGDIRSKEDVLVEGVVEGRVEAKNILIQNGGSVRDGAAAEDNLEIHGNIDGDISGKNIRLCQSKIHGNITSKGRISVDKDSILNGDVTEGEDIDVYGRIRGMISVNGKATIHRGAIVKGSVRCHDIYLETGAKFQGSVEQVSSEDISDDLFE